jgi:hypothetical protein
MSLTAAPNLVKNGSFENNLEHWKTWWAEGDDNGAQLGHSKDSMADGRYSLKALLPHKPSRWSVRQDIAVTPEADYEFSFMFFTANTNPGSAMVRISFFDAKGQHMGYVGQRNLPPTANIWCDYRQNITVSTDVVRVTVEFNFYGPGCCYLDNIVFRRMADNSAGMAGLYLDNRPMDFPLNVEPDPALVFPYWSYTNAAKRIFKLAAALGTPYSKESEFKEAARHRLAPFYNMWHADSPADAKKHQLPILYYPASPVYARIAADKPAGDYISGNALNANDPVVVEALLREIKNENFAHADTSAPMFFFMRDEIYGNSIRMPRDLKNLKSDYWRNMDGNVREQYGFGRFGMPDGPDDKDPFKWIAFARYQNDLTLKILTGMRDRFKARFPHARVIGCDEWSAQTPLDWEKMGELVDIQPGQTLHTRGGAHRYATAYLTKFYADLGGKPVYPYLQIVKYPVAPTPDFLSEIVNQGLRSGAEGFFVGTVEWYDRGNEAPKFGAPENWATYLARLDQVRRLKPVELPDDKLMALHFSSYTQMSRGHSPQGSLGSWFALLGPLARSWFTFIDDYRLERDPAKLDPYSVIVVADARFTSDKVLSAMERAVAAGRTLLVLDPEAFSYLLDGTEPAERREKLFGARTELHDVPRRKIKLGRTTLDNSDVKSYKITVTDPGNTRVVATFEDRTPAILEHKFGEGKVWYFACNLGNNFTVDSPDWIRQLRQWLPQWGAKIDYPVWRMHLPPVTLPKPLERQYRCLTGNGLLMVRNHPDVSMNPAQATGSYRYRTAPLAIPDIQEGAVPFGKGRLTDRRRYAEIAKDNSGNFVDPADMNPENWLVRFGPGETSANSITFDLGKISPAAAVRLFAGGSLPATELSVSTDGKTWRKAASHPAVETAEDALAELKFDCNVNARYYRISYPERPAGTSLWLAEADIWGK